MVTVSGLHNQKGFTLVEIMDAISIIAIALLGLVSVTVIHQGKYVQQNNDCCNNAGQ